MNKLQSAEEAEFAGRQGIGTGPRWTIIAAILGGVSVGIIWLVAAIAQGPDPKPICEGYGVGSMTIREKDYFTELKFDGCEVECFDRFVVIHIDKAREPTWTDNYIKVVPWEKVEHMTLLPHEPGR